jgi:hypothetical protein
VTKVTKQRVKVAKTKVELNVRGWRGYERRGLNQEDAGGRRSRIKQRLARDINRGGQIDRRGSTGCEGWLTKLTTKLTKAEAEYEAKRRTTLGQGEE